MKFFPNTQVPITYENLMASIYESNRFLTEKIAETEREWKEKTAENDRFLTEKFAETDRLIKANSRDIGGITKSNGEIAEAYFYRCFSKYPHFAGQDYLTVVANKSSSSEALNLRDEYDIVLYNGSSIGIIEVKYKATKEDVAQVLHKVETFKALFPIYKDFSFYLGLAGFHIYKNAENEAIKQGVAIIKQEGKKMVIEDAHLKVF
jgi:hypothetical protein